MLLEKFLMTSFIYYIILILNASPRKPGSLSLNHTQRRYVGLALHYVIWILAPDKNLNIHYF